MTESGRQKIGSNVGSEPSMKSVFWFAPGLSGRKSEIELIASVLKKDSKHTRDEKNAF